MKTLGIVFLIVGLLLGVYALCMDTSVALTSNFSVNNAGLMNDRTTYLIFSGILSIIGALFMVMAYIKEPVRQKKYGPHAHDGNAEDERANKLMADEIETLFLLKEKGAISNEEYLIRLQKALGAKG